MSVVAVNAMTRAVLAPKAAGAKPRASAFVGRPAALKARVAGTRSIPPREPPPPARTTRSRFVPPGKQIQIHARRRRREATTSISLDFDPTS